MAFSNSYFEDEVRDGFFISSFTKRWMAEQYYLLEEIDKVCQKHNLKWFADWGTLLGAVRHKGFIPWDDDIDICMPRSDYERFREIFSKEFPKEYILSDYHNTLMEFTIGITNGKTIHTGDELKRHDYYPFVAGIDIFPIDYLPESDSEKENLKRIIARTYEIIFYIDKKNKKQKQDITEKEFEEKLKETETYFHCRIDRNKPMLVKLYSLLEKEMSKYWEGKDSEGNKLSMLSDIPWWRGRGDYCCFDVKDYSESVRVPFEEGYVNIPVGYDAVLNKEYKDYHVFVRKSSSHGYPAFDQALKLWESTFNAPFFRYSFNPDDLENPERIANSKVLQRYESILQLLKEYNSVITEELKNPNIGAVQNMLADCQDAVVEISGEIDNSEGTWEKSVLQLDRYCKALFEAYQAVGKGNISEACSQVKEIEEEILPILQGEYYKNEDGKKDAVFIVRRFDDWKKMEKLFVRVKASGRYRISVVPIPYYYINTAGDVTENVWEEDRFNDLKEFEDYRAIDIKALHPELIITQYPFDGYNYAYTLPKEYFTKELKKHTEELIYVSPFITDEFDESDERSIKVMEYYCLVSGVVNADHTIVQSENMRRHYVKKLTEWSGADLEPVWNEKVISDLPMIKGRKI